MVYNSQYIVFRIYCIKEVDMRRTEWNYYTIMHKEKAVACIHRNGRCELYCEKFMPYNLYLENSGVNNIDECINNLENFYYWCSSRMLTLDRKYAKEILNTLGRKQAVTDRDRADIALSYHCLSLTDVYWVRGEEEEISFEDINLYNNSLSGAFVDVCLRGKGMTAQNAQLLEESDVAGDLATSGVAPKAWVRRGKTFGLLKDGDIRDVKAELLASKIIDCFDVSHVRYCEDMYEGQLVSASEIISSLEMSLVPAEFVEIYAANNDMGLLDIVLEKDSYSYHMMNIMDYLIGNSDRHWGNWGFYVDNETNELIRLYPLMDFNKAFTAYEDMSGGLCLTAGRKMTQQEAATIGIRTIGLNQIAEVMPEWFENNEWREMFNQRLSYLKKEANYGYEETDY